jgi:hypothetical protein
MGKNFYRGVSLNDSEMVNNQAWLRYCRDMWTRKQAVMGRIAPHRRLIDHVRGQAVRGESASAATKRMAANIATGRDLATVAQPVMASQG